MTWSVKASGHHNTSDWKAEEHELLRGLVEAVGAEDTVTSNFEFTGNHVQASSLADAEAKLEAYDKGAAAASPEQPADEGANADEGEPSA